MLDFGTITLAMESASDVSAVAMRAPAYYAKHEMTIDRLIIIESLGYFYSLVKFWCVFPAKIKGKLYLIIFNALSDYWV